MVIDEGWSAEGHGPELAAPVRALLDTSPDAVLIVDQGGRIVALNHRAETMFGASVEVLRGKPVETLIPDRFRRSHASARTDYAHAPTVRGMSTREGLKGLRGDGTEFPVEISLTPVLGSADGLVMAVVHDVTLRAGVEAAIAGPDRATNALEAIADAVFTTDVHGNVDFLNRAAEELTGQDLESARGRPLFTILPLVSESSGVSVPSRIAQCLRQGSSASCEARLPPRAGNGERVLDLSTSALRGPSGAVCGGVVVARDITQARLIARRLSHEATHDALTGLVNRSEFERRLARALDGDPMQVGQHAVCFLDLDGFKQINDTCGHSAGDELLQQLSDLMRERVRARDTLARLGGDEFGLLLERCGLPRAERIAEGIRRAVETYRFTVGGQTHAVGISIGIVLTRAGARPADVLRAADAACYRAKHGGGNRVQCSIGLRSRRDEQGQAAWPGRLQRALDEERFRLFAQPLMPLDPAGEARPRFEVLLTLQEDRQGPITAHTFLPAAKRAGLMPAIDAWVLRHASRRLADWQAGHPGADLTLAINLADETLAAGHAATLVQDAMAHAGLRPQSLGV
jgi:diguanylate cyclase (GGDEF)-like protein/PAS domain S-box-containing protein